ncbi:hypothetical protein [Ectobacillus polymachus]|uniref:hypothetical protein n=1 Tax=Ectobacillus polymachus TaxID=1508806 RepID=UPI003A888C11
MGRMTVYPQSMEQVSQTIQDTVRSFEQLIGEFSGFLDRLSFEQIEREKLIQSRNKWNEISQMLVEVLEEQASFLSETANELRLLDEEFVNLEAFHTAGSSFLSAMSFQKLQNVYGANISNPQLTRHLLSLGEYEKKGMESDTRTSGDFSSDRTEDVRYDLLSNTLSNKAGEDVLQTETIFEGIQFRNVEKDEDDLLSIKDKLKSFVLEKNRYNCT